MPSNSLDARVLLGWMQAEDAVRFLSEECEFDAAPCRDDALRMWESAKRRIMALPPASACEHPVQHRLNSADHKIVQKFRRQYSRATDIIDFLKVDPMSLIVHQLFVVTDVQESLREAVMGEGWFRTALLDVQNQAAVKWRVEADQVVFELPHGEFFLSAPKAHDTRLQLLQNPAFVAVARLKNRLLLANGYHRLFARAMVGPAEPLLFACSEQLPFGSTRENDTLRETLLSPRPPLFADFFDERAYVSVRMKKKRGYEMRVRVEMTALYQDGNSASGASG